MNQWDVLEIEATKDVSVIKKAYARNLKKHRPEDDPQGYQNLREAYDSAINYAKYSREDNSIKHAYVENIEDNEEDNTEDNTEEPSVLNNRFSLKHAFTSLPIIEESNFNDSYEELNNEFMDRVEALYSDSLTRIDIQNWINLFDSKVIWNCYNRENIGLRLLEFLSNHRNLPQNIWVFLDLSFNWSSQAFYYEDDYLDIINYIKEKVENKKGLSYNFHEFESSNVIDDPEKEIKSFEKQNKTTLRKKIFYIIFLLYLFLKFIRGWG